MNRATLQVVAIAFLLASCTTPQEMAGEGFARFAIEVKAPVAVPKVSPKSIRILPVNGILEIDSRQGSACLTLSGTNFSDAELSNGTESAASFSPAESVAGDICQRGIAEATLQGVIERWEDYSLHVSFAEAPSSEGGLRYMDQSG